MPVAVTTAIKWLTEATRSLSQETADQTTTTQGVWASLSSQFPEWTADERLRESVSPLISLIPSGSSTACPTLHALANALHQTGDNLSDLSDDWTERQLIEGMHRRLERITRSPRPPKLVSGLFAKVAAPQKATSSVESQMVSALRLSVMRAMHDANNTITPIGLHIQEAMKKSSGLTALATENKHLLPPDAGEMMMAYLGEIDRHVKDVDSLVSRTAKLIRNVWDAIRETGKSEADIARMQRLFEGDGLVSRISFVLVDLLTDLQNVDRNIERLREMARIHGHHVPPEVLKQGLDFLTDLSQATEMYRDVVMHIVEIFKFLRDVSVGTMTSAPETLDLRDRLNGKVIRMVMGRGVEVELKIDPSPWSVFGMPNHLWQILINLLSNSRDAMKDQGRLEVSTEKATLDAAVAASLEADLILPTALFGEFMVLRVKDSGHGIPASILPRIFERSFSGKESTGLGLEATLAIVVEMGGFIAVNTSVEEPTGTTFSIYFPRAS